MNEQGISLIESLLVVAIVGSIVLLLSSVPNSLMLLSKSRHLSLAREIAAKQIEDKRALSYINLANDNSPVSDSRLAQLPFGSGTVVVEDCDVSLCANGENIKQVTTTVNWKDNNKDQTISVKTMISEGGINQ